MGQTKIYQQGVEEIIVPAAQSIAISNFGGGIAKIYYLIETPAFPDAWQLQQTLEDSSVTLGAFSAQTIVKIEAGNSIVVYDVGVSPDTGIGDADTLNGLTSDAADTPNTIAARDANGDIQANAFESTVATGTAPLTVASTTLVTNLNADLLDNLNSATAATASTIVARDSNADITGRRFISGLTTGTSPLSVTSTTVNTNLNADLLDGYHEYQLLKQPGITWTTRTSAVDNDWTSICYGNGLFVAVSNTGTGTRVMTSPDGINWTIRTSAADNAWYSVCYGNGLFVAVAASGTGTRVMTSPDGITWTIRTSAADNSWASVCYGNGLFVAVSNTGTGTRVMTSPDGITWTIRTSAADNSWASVCYGNGLFVAVAYSGTDNRVMTSPDGITWTSRTSAADNSWRSVCYSNGLFVAVSNTGTGNRVMTSTDGITWTTRTSASDNNWRAVCYGNGLFVALAYSGTGNRVMTSGYAELMEDATLDHIHRTIDGNIIWTEGNLGAGTNGTLQLPSLAADPASGEAAGQIYYNTTSNVVRFYNGSAWGDI